MRERERKDREGGKGASVVLEEMATTIITCVSCTCC